MLSILLKLHMLYGEFIDIYRGKTLKTHTHISTPVVHCKYHQDRRWRRPPQWRAGTQAGWLGHNKQYSLINHIHDNVIHSSISLLSVKLRSLSPEGLDAGLEITQGFGVCSGIIFHIAFAALLHILMRQVHELLTNGMDQPLAANLISCSPTIML